MGVDWDGAGRRALGRQGVVGMLMHALACALPSCPPQPSPCPHASTRLATPAPPAPPTPAPLIPAPHRCPPPPTHTTTHTSRVQDIFIARAEGELALEEELYWTLVNIHRLPALMFELTKTSGMPGGGAPAAAPAPPPAQ